MKEKLTKILSKADLGSLISYEWLGDGYSSVSYKVTSSKGEYVILLSKSSTLDPDSYNRQFGYLRALDKIGYSHAPRALYVSDHGDCLVLTLAVGKPISAFSQAPPEKRKAIAHNLTKALIDLADLKKSTASEVFEDLNITVPKDISARDSWQQYVIDRFEPYAETNTNDPRTQWIQRETKKFTLQEGTDHHFFMHGDTSSPNVIVGADLSVTFIDWGEAGFHKTQEKVHDYGVAYCFNHLEIMQEFKDDVINIICDTKSLSQQKLIEYVAEKQKTIKIADIVWAHMMYVRAQKREIEEDPRAFDALLNQRITEYKQMP